MRRVMGDGMIGWLDRFFEIGARGSTPGREVLAGATTWLTLAYIVLVNPVVLGATGMDSGAVMVATCVGAALATAGAGIFARLPVALAPGMGLNFFFAFTLCGAAATGGFGLSWQQALAATFIAGTLFLASALFRLRSRLMEIVPEPLRHAIVAGIGLMIAVIGLRWAGLLVATPSIYIGPGDIGQRPVQVALVGLLVTAILVIRRVPGALLIGAGLSGALSLAFGLTQFTGVVSAPPSILPTLLALDFGGLFAAPTWIFAVVVLLMVDMFDTVGTLLGVTSRAGLEREGHIPRAEAAFAADAGGTMVGSLLGTSTITTYIESAAGIAAGGRTGLTSLTTAGLLLCSMFFYPLLSLIGGVPVGDGVILYPVAAPILILIGVFMMPEIGRVAWDRPLAAIPAFFVVVVMPLTTSITNGIGAGFIAWSVLHLLSGKARDTSPVTHALAGLFLILFLLE